MIIRRELELQGLTHRELGGMVGLSPSQIGKFLRAERVFNIEQLARACRALGLDLVDTLTEALRSP